MKANGIRAALAALSRAQHLPLRPCSTARLVATSSRPPGPLVVPSPRCWFGTRRPAQRAGWKKPADEGLLQPKQLMVKLTQAKSARRILDVWSSHGDAFDAINCSTAVHRLAKNCKKEWRELRHDPDSISLTRKIAGILLAHGFDPQAISNTLWAYATAEVAAPAVFEAAKEAA